MKECGVLELFYFTKFDTMFQAKEEKKYYDFQMLHLEIKLILS